MTDRITEEVGMAKSAHVRRLDARVAQTAARFAEHAAATGATVADLATLKLPWYEIRNVAPETPDEPPTVLIFGEIGGSFGVSSKQFASDLLEIDAPAITVRINSPGGSVFDGLAIYNALNHHPAKITVYVDAIAASAASIIAMGGDEIVMMPGSQMMIHDASMVEDGNQADHEAAAIHIGRQSDNVADIYRMRAGGDVDQWRSLMLAETWMFGAEAVEMRLADRTQEPSSAAKDALPEQMTRSWDLSQYRYAGRGVAPEPQKVSEVRPMIRRSSLRTAAPIIELAARGQGKGTERRGYSAQYEVRGMAGSTVEVRGYATVYNTYYEMWDEFGSYEEQVRGGAGRKTLSENPQVQFLPNHGGLSMAYTRAKTLILAEDSTGLDVSAFLDSRRTDVTDLLLAIERGDLDEMSFAFRVPTGRSIWSNDYSRRDITEYDLSRGDVSAVNFGANPSTFVGVRASELDRMEETAARALYERLGRRLIVEAPRSRAEALNPTVDAADGDVPCPTCAAVNSAEAIYCDQCGARLDGATDQKSEPTTKADQVAVADAKPQRRPALSLQEQAADDDAQASAVLVEV